MIWLQGMNQAISYIEDNLEGEISFYEAAKIALCSTYHFQRMFSFLLDLPLSEYIRRRRLTLAAFELQSSNIKIIDLALKYGYESPDSFTRAFVHLHGVTPTSARETGVTLKAFPRISFHISVKGDVEMNYRMETQAAFQLFGKAIVLRPEDDLYEVLPAFGDEIWEDGTHNRINDIAENPHGSLLFGVYFDYKEDGSRSYMFAANKPEKEIPKEFTVVDIPSTTWVVFEESGSMPDQIAIQKIWKRVYSEWFPSSGYEQSQSPCIEKYFWLDASAISYRCEVWIPVVKNETHC
jgi:AraC family transcriptional regulator